MYTRFWKSLVLDERFWTLARLVPWQGVLYRVCFLAGAARHGVLARLAEGPVSFDDLAARYAPHPSGRDALESWLRVGCLVNELSLGPRGYELKGFLARKLAMPLHDATAAFLEEIVTLHARLLLETPGLLAQGRRFALADADGELIARSSRILEPVVAEAIRMNFPPQGPARLLEVGCGSGTYLRHAAQLNPELSGRGLELQTAVAEQARKNLEQWELGGRFEIAVGDIRDQHPDPGSPFDLVTLHNNIYYFPVSERTALLRHLRGFLRPGGLLLITTGTKGGAVGLELLSLWASATEGCGPLPESTELVEQLRDAGFEPEQPHQILPGQAFYGFVGRT
jgi:SAM-dependent methyltransferase